MYPKVGEHWHLRSNPAKPVRVIETYPTEGYLFIQFLTGWGIESGLVFKRRIKDFLDFYRKACEYGE